jgi:Tol biopolymer transport system component
MCRSLALIGLLTAGIVQLDANAEQGRILFTRDGQVWTVAPESSETTGPLAMVASIESLSVSPDGRYVACTTSPSDGLYIYRVSADGEPVQLQHLRPALARVHGHTWSPDGRYLAVQTSSRLPELTMRVGPVSKPQSTPDDLLLGITELLPPRNLLHILPWQTDGQRAPDGTGDGAGLGHAVVPPLRISTGEWYAWVPGANAIAWTPPWGGDIICVTDLATGHTTDTRPSGPGRLGTIIDYAWSPDGGKLAYITAKGLLLVRAGGTFSGEVLVRKGDAWRRSLRWSPDGSRLAYGRQAPTEDASFGFSPAMDLCVLDVRSGRETDLTNGEIAVNSDSISWSPDGALIAFDGCSSAALAAQRESRGRGYGSGYAQCDLYVADAVSGVLRLVQEGCGRNGYGSGTPIPWLPPVRRTGW